MHFHRMTGLPRAKVLVAGLAVAAICWSLLVGSGGAGAGAAEAPQVGNDAYSIPIGGTLHLPAPGLLANDDSLPAGLHVHEMSTLTTFYGYATFENLADDGSVDISVGTNTTGGQSYDLEYCFGPSTNVGSECTSNVATVRITAVAPQVGNDAYSIPIGGTLHLPAPGLLANDDPLPAGLHVHEMSTLTTFYGYARFENLADDGSVDISVGTGVTGGQSYDLEYCFGPSTNVGSECSSNRATVRITAVAPQVGNDAYSIPIGGTLHVPAPGLLANDDPLQPALHVHEMSTLTTFYGYAKFENLADDGSVDISVGTNTTGGQSYDLEYCFGPSATEGSECTSNRATVRITAVAPHLGDDAYTVKIGTTKHLPAPGLLTNDDPLQPDLHVHVNTTMASSSGYARLVNLADDGSVDVKVFDITEDGASYRLEYCYGVTSTEGSACTSNVATVLVTAVTDQAPVATADAYDTPAATALHVTAPGLLGNDTDADGDPITAVLVSPPDPSQGSVSLAANGSFTFTPASGFSGDATFTYRATDGTESSSTTTVTVTVAPPPTSSTTTAPTSTTTPTSTTGPTATTPPPAPAAQAANAVPQGTGGSGSLPYTGTDTGRAAALGLGAVVGGALLAFAARRRRQARSS